MDTSKQYAKQTLVEEGTELKGTLTSTCQVVVNGTIDGQIQAPELHVAQSGMLLGIVKAGKLRCEGTLAGSIEADDVYLSGTVRSNTMIRAGKLEAKLGAERGKLEVTFGECLLEVGDDPAREARAPEAGGRGTDGAETAREGADGVRAIANVAVGEGGVREGAEGTGTKEGNGRRGKQSGERRDSQAPSS